MNPADKAILLQISLAVLAIIPGILAVLIGIWNTHKIHEVHLTINSRLDQLVAASIAKGRIAERDEMRNSAEIKAAELVKGAAVVAADLVLDTVKQSR